MLNPAPVKISAKLCICFIVSFLLLILFTNKTFALGLGYQTLAKLKNGKVVTEALLNERHHKGAKGLVLIDAPPEEVWKLIGNKEFLATFIPKLKKAKTLEKGNNYQKVYMAVKIYRFLPTFKFTMLFDEKNKHKKMIFTKVNGCFQDIYGSIKFIPYNGKTILVYKMYIEVGFFIPSFIGSNSVKKDLPDLLSRIKKQVENNKKYYTKN